jgi:hypothetical protein
VLQTSQHGYCIFHEQCTTKDVNAFNAGIERKLNSRDFDFTGYYFPTSTTLFRKFHFDTNALFRLARFCGNVDFREATFSGEHTDFAQAKFLGENTCFTLATFASKNTYFNQAEFSSEQATGFNEATFLGPTSFFSAKFSSKNTDFSNCKFSGSDIIFNEAEFTGESTDFSGAEFASERAYFNSVNFVAEQTTFSKARFSGASTGFASAKFMGRGADFTHVRFSAVHTDFADVELAGENTDFAAARFVGDEVEFAGARFLAENTDFCCSHFSGNHTSFAGAHFSGERVTFFMTEFCANETVFGGARFSPELANFFGARFFSTWTDFHGADVASCTFLDTMWHRVGFPDATWNSKPGRPFMCWDEFHADSPGEYASAASVCRNIKQAYRGTGDYERAGEFFYGEMECTRKSMPRSLKRLGLTLLNLICGYGERPFWVVRTWAVVVLFFAVAYAFSGIATNGVTTRLVFGGLDAWVTSPLSQFKTVAEHLWHSFYFSGVTFTTLGYGDFHPAGALTQMLAVTEASLGAFLMALFILVVGRKLLR